MSMQLNPSEISELIKERIKDFDAGAEARTEGTVVSLTDGICRIHGLADAMQGEMLEFPNDTFGLALNLEQDSVGAVVLGDYEHIVEGDTVKCTGRILEVPIGRACLAAWSIPSARRSMAKARSKQPARHRLRASRLALSRVSRFRSPCKPASRRLTQWCRLVAGSVN